MFVTFDLKVKKLKVDIDFHHFKSSPQFFATVVERSGWGEKWFELEWWIEIQVTSALLKFSTWATGSCLLSVKICFLSCHFFRRTSQNNDTVSRRQKNRCQKFWYKLGKPATEFKTSLNSVYWSHTFTGAMIQFLPQTGCRKQEPRCSLSVPGYSLQLSGVRIQFTG